MNQHWSRCSCVTRRKPSSSSTTSTLPTAISAVREKRKPHREFQPLPNVGFDGDCATVAVHDIVSGGEGRPGCFQRGAEEPVGSAPEDRPSALSPHLYNDARVCVAGLQNQLTSCKNMLCGLYCQ